MPTFILAPASRDGALEVLLQDREVPTLAIHAVWPETRHLPPKVRTFDDFLVARFVDAPGSISMHLQV